MRARWSGHPNFEAGFVTNVTEADFRWRWIGYWHLAVRPRVHYQHNPIKRPTSFLAAPTTCLGLARRVGARLLMASPAKCNGDTGGAIPSRRAIAAASIPRHPRLLRPRVSGSAENRSGFDYEADARHGDPHRPDHLSTPTGHASGRRRAGGEATSSSTRCGANLLRLYGEGQPRPRSFLLRR